MEKYAEKPNFTSNAVIKVIGVGGGGGNALNTMIESGLSGVEFIAANTDVQALQANHAPVKIQLGKELTKGLGAGANPDTGRNAALEDKAILQEVLGGADMVFVTGGMGGGTGTGAAPIIAQVARELGALTVGVVTKPFSFEGKRRRQQSELGIQALRQSVDTLITIPNQRLLSIAPPEMSMLEGFKLADEVLLNAVKGISDIINIPGRVNVDFADVKTIMSEMGMALMGIGTATGANRATEAARCAINSPLLEDIDIEGATGILINITGSSSMTLHEISEASTLIQEAAHEESNIIFGAVIDETMEENIRVTVIATGFDQARLSFGDQNQFANSQAPQNQAPYMSGYHASSQNQRTGAHGHYPVSTGSHNLSSENPYSGRQNATAPQGTNRNQFCGSQNPSTPHNPFARSAPQYQQSQNSQQQYAHSKTIPTAQNGREQGHKNPQNSYGTIQSTPQSQPSAETERWGGQTEISANPSAVPTNPFYQEPQGAQPTAIDTVTDAPASGRQESLSHLNQGENPETTESALKLAKELSRIEIDEADFDTPSFLRRKDDGTKTLG